MKTDRGILATRAAPDSRSGKSISVFPGATAMVWPGVGHGHEAVAVPGVRLEPGDAIVAVELATVCDADVRTVTGERIESAPAILGHETVGRVVALGHGGAKSIDGHRIAIGSRVVWAVTAPCGRCTACRRGAGHLCLSHQRYGHARVRRGWELSGGFATHVHVVAGTPIALVPEELPAAVLAPVSCSISTAMAVIDSASEVVGPLAGSVLVVNGARMVGLAICAAATDLGARVVVADADPVARDRALAFGAVAVADPGASSASHRVDGTVARVTGRSGSFLVAVDTLGSAHAHAAASARAAASGTAAAPGTHPHVDPLAWLGGNARATISGSRPPLDPGGVLVLAGSPEMFEDAVLDSAQLVRQGLTVRGVHAYSPEHLRRAVQFITRAADRFPFAQAIGETFALHAVDDALAFAHSGLAPRAAVDPRIGR